MSRGQVKVWCQLPAAGICFSCREMTVGSLGTCLTLTKLKMFWIILKANETKAVNLFKSHPCLLFLNSELMEKIQHIVGKTTPRVV